MHLERNPSHLASTVAVMALTVIVGATFSVLAQEPAPAPDQDGPGDLPHQEPLPGVNFEERECHPDLIASCSAIGGVASYYYPTATGPGGASGIPQCVCDVLIEGAARIVNARHGDVALVPLTDPAGLRGGDANVAAVMESIGQWHRHTTIFSDDSGRRVTHLTTFIDIDTADLRWAWLPPIPWDLDPFVLEHGARVGDPTSDTLLVGQALGDALSPSDRSRSRMDNTGLILKPYSESERGLFTAAEARTRGMSFFYRVSDYTSFTGTSLPTSGASSLAGTHCAGLIFEAFRPDYPAMSLVSYPESVRIAAGEALYDVVRDKVRASSSMASWVGLANRIANQATNCFAGLGCANTTDAWRSPGPGLTVSPDNLLPTSFSVTNVSDLPDMSDPSTPPICTSPFVNCDHATTNLQGGFRVTRVAPNRVDAEHDNGQSTTPFRRIEPQVIADGSVNTVRLYRW